MTVGVGHSRRYCNTGYDQSQGRRPSTLKCIGPISKGDIEPNHPSEINPNSDSRSRSDGRSRRFVQCRVDQSQGQRPRSLLITPITLRLIVTPKNLYPRSENSAYANVTVFPISLILAVDRVRHGNYYIFGLSLHPWCKQELRSQISKVSILNSPC